MGSYKADQPRANPPICWACDRMLHGAGRFYVMVDGHPYHKACAPESAIPQSTEGKEGSEE